MEKALLPLLHDIGYDMYGPQNFVGIIKPAITSTVTWGQEYVCLPRPTTYNLTIQDNATLVVQNRMEAAHTLLLQYYYSYASTEKGAAKFIRESVEKTFYKDLEHATTFYNIVMAKELLLHLQTNCGGAKPKNLIALQTAMSSYYTE